ncbi:MAG: MerR family transcriptional regulator [Thermomicrobiales bacterium]
MEQLTIGEVAKRAGLRPSAIRYYESAGLLPSPGRVGGQRRYDTGVLDRLAVIRLAQQAGFTVAEIRQMLTGFDPTTPFSVRWRALAERKLTEIDELIARAEAMKGMLKEGLRCGCLSWDDCALVARAAERQAAG